MSDRAPTFVSFTSPPIQEVALAVQFQPQAVGLLDIATFSEAVQKSYPKIQERPAQPPMGEDFGPPGLGMQIQLLPGPALPRVWFLSEDESHLIQVQHDLLAINWRRMASGVAYPRYERLRPAVRTELRRLQTIVGVRGTSLTPNWCEVTYINQIPTVDEPASRPPLHWLLARLRSGSRERFLPELEDAQLVWRYVIPGDEEPQGRLSVTAQSAIRNVDAAPIWTLTLTARVRAPRPDLQGALDALDIGREWVVKGFFELTTARMHKQWGYQEIAQ